jgi:hypothetical protein
MNPVSMPTMDATMFRSVSGFNSMLRRKHRPYY